MWIGPPRIRAVCGLPGHMLQLWTRGLSTPALPVVFRLARGLHLQVDDLLFGTIDVVTVARSKPNLSLAGIAVEPDDHVCIPLRCAEVVEDRQASGDETRFTWRADTLTSREVSNRAHEILRDHDFRTRLTVPQLAVAIGCTVGFLERTLPNVRAELVVRYIDAAWASLQRDPSATGNARPTLVEVLNLLHMSLGTVRRYHPAFYASFKKRRRQNRNVEQLESALTPFEIRQHAEHMITLHDFHERLQVRDIAQAIGCSVRTLVESYPGIHQYLMERYLDVVCTPVAAIIDELGYTSSSVSDVIQQCGISRETLRLYRPELYAKLVGRTGQAEFGREI